MALELAPTVLHADMIVSPWERAIPQMRAIQEALCNMISQERGYRGHDLFLDSACRDTLRQLQVHVIDIAHPLNSADLVPGKHLAHIFSAAVQVFQVDPPPLGFSEWGIQLRVPRVEVCERGAAPRPLHLDHPVEAGLAELLSLMLLEEFVHCEQFIRQEARKGPATAFGAYQSPRDNEVSKTTSNLGERFLRSKMDAQGWLEIDALGRLVELAALYQIDFSSLRPMLFCFHIETRYEFVNWLHMQGVLDPLVLPRWRELLDEKQEAADPAIYLRKLDF